ncbi:AraC family transcriptional regulator [Streptomyces sp. VRA16 Mangrove soil]|uniref:AraC family transcriptional regulator n=1 Tax=Streptomyces sp. VRA16 Mangrove soil TaxID=2817434 RepID=UPI001A9DFF42|nr:AraC family transcriptional regulator [Streptomyces sp. VRA16 Mangrove soil]MBO1337130.1 AraC family transcriptional regulator [Streptomyces sp. VRA16 Mangrove soil]
MDADRGQGSAAAANRFTTRSVDEARAVLSQQFYDMKLDTSAAETFDLDADVVLLGGVTLGRMSFGASITAFIPELGGYHIVAPTTGSFGIGQGPGAYTQVSARTGGMLNPTADFRVGDFSPDCDTLTIKVDRAAMHRQLESMLGRPVRRGIGFRRDFDISAGTGRSWAELARWAARDVNNPGGLLESPMIRGRLEQTLLEGLLLSTGHRYRDALDAPPPGMSAAAVKRVMDAVRDNPAAPWDGGALAAVARVSLRTLQEAFRKQLRMTPMAYVHEVRLQHVRMELRRAVPGATTVTETAYRWGFAHLGRFARRYRTRFGETPSQTLAAALGIARSG